MPPTDGPVSPGETNTCGRDGRILVLVRRRLPLIFMFTLPACLSGFSEIRVVRPDAAVDSARFDAVIPADAPGVPSDAPDVLQVPDVQPAAMDAPEVAISGDSGPGFDVPDVVDAGQQLADAVDVVGEDHVDARSLTDLADSFDAQCPSPLCNGVCVNTDTDPAHCGRCGNSCGSGEECVGGRCGRWAFRAVVTVSGAFGTEDGLRRYVTDRCQTVAAVPCPSTRSLIEAAVDRVSRADGGQACGALLTSEVVAVRSNLYVAGCWSCVAPPNVVAGGCGLSPPNLLACCAFE
jgi:hypothetical protein